MMTFRRFESGPQDIPGATAWYLADLGEARGKQELFRRQFPQKLKVLREHAIIESAISSNRIEGVEVDQSRIQTILFGRSQLRDRNEEEVRGYRNALKLIHEHHQDLEVSDETIKKLHRVARAEIGDAGEYKERDSDIIERYPNGAVRVRFRTVPASQAAQAMGELVERWNRCLRERWMLAAVRNWSISAVKWTSDKNALK
jgi:Fic family protein